MQRFLCIIAACAIALASELAFAQYVRPEGAKGLPKDQEYQRQLQAWWGKLTAADFTLPAGEFTAATLSDPDDKLRVWMLSIHAPPVGAKRAAPSLNTNPRDFLLSHVESPNNGKVIQPAVWGEPLTLIANWNNPGNPYANSKAAKLRAFVWAAQDMMMIDEQQEHSSKFPMWRRADWFGPHLIAYAYVYAGTKDALPDEARKAFEVGLKRMILRVCKWGPKGEETYLDMVAVTGMLIAEKTLNDPEVTAAVGNYIKPFFTEGEFYNAAGYFPDQGCYDAGFNGLSLYFATWAALASDRPEVKAAAAQAWKLRGYMLLPEPDKEMKLTHGQTFAGPTHATFRTGSPAGNDQWQWPSRPFAGALLTDDAMCQAAWPDNAAIDAGAAVVIQPLSHMKHETLIDVEATTRNKVNTFMKVEDLKSGEWAWRFWPGSGDFAMTNVAYDYYPKGFAARRAALAAKNPEMFKIPFERNSPFVEQFGNAFLVAKNAGGASSAKPDTFGVIVHTGPVSQYPGKELLEYPNAPYGLGGGTLSAFWTPATGSILLGRRGGMNAPGGQPTCFDKPEEWRNWPVHAVIGTVDGKSFFTSARIQRPDSSYEIKDGKATVKASGVIPAVAINQGPAALKGKLDFARTFSYTPEGLKVETTVKGDSADAVAELYEAIPVFHRDKGFQGDEIKPGVPLVTKIELQSGGNWAEATDKYTANVTAIRLTRFTGKVLIKFDKPQRVKLSPAEASGGFLTGHVSRNVLIDLLGGDQATAIKDAKTVAWTITPAQ